MKRIHFFLALSVLFVFVGSSFALQARGQGRASVPSNAALGGGNPGTGHADTHATNSNAGLENSGKPENPRNEASTRDTEGFKNYGLYVAAQHVSENLGIPFDQLKAKMTGPHPESLGKAIQELTGLPASAANAEAKKAEQASKSEGKKH